jgi:hypothetical protein
VAGQLQQDSPKKRLAEACLENIGQGKGNNVKTPFRIEQIIEALNIRDTVPYRNQTLERLPLADFLGGR